MTVSDVLSAVDASGVTLACLGLLGLVARIYAWRARVNDVRRHAEALLRAGGDPARRAALESNPPPPLTDQVLKVAAVLYLSGMAMAAVRPVYVASASARRAGDLDAAGEASRKLGPQTSVDDALASWRWTDGIDPFEVDVDDGL